MTGEPAGDKPGTQPAEAAPLLTYSDVSSRYGPDIHAARERYEELATRDALARAYAQLKVSGTYDPARHGTGNTKPLPTAEHLELLALAQYLSRSYKPSVKVDHALRAGATWEQVARALGTDEASARGAYREWADRQHDLLTWTQGRIGMRDAEHAAAVERAAGPDREAGQRTSCAGNCPPLTADQAQQDAREAGS